MKERDENRERFLAAISERIPVESVIEVHLFQPIKQGGTESGVAVVAVDERKPREATDGEAAAENVPDAQSASAENIVSDAQSASAENTVSDRLAVYTAHYRLTQKGPERGKWEFGLQVEADAPLITVDRVVQGVQRRVGDAEEPIRLSGDDFRDLVPQPERH